MLSYSEDLNDLKALRDIYTLIILKNTEIFLIFRNLKNLKKKLTVI